MRDTFTPSFKSIYFKILNFVCSLIVPILDATRVNQFNCRVIFTQRNLIFTSPEVGNRANQRRVSLKAFCFLWMASTLLMSRFTLASLHFRLQNSAQKHFMFNLAAVYKICFIYDSSFRVGTGNI